MAFLFNLKALKIYYFLFLERNDIIFKISQRIKQLQKQIHTV